MDNYNKYEGDLKNDNWKEKVFIILQMVVDMNEIWKMGKEKEKQNNLF